jgi:hypothetical protein
MMTTDQKLITKSIHDTETIAVTTADQMIDVTTDTMTADVTHKETELAKRRREERKMSADELKKPDVARKKSDNVKRSEEIKLVNHDHTSHTQPMRKSTIHHRARAKQHRLSLFTSVNALNSTATPRTI